MEFYLVKNQKLRFFGDKLDDDGHNWITRNTENEIIAELTPVIKNYASEILTERVHAKILKSRENNKIAWDFNLKIELPNALPNDEDEKSVLLFSSIRLSSYGENNFLYRIGSMFSKHDNISTASVKFIANDFGPIQNMEQVDGYLRPTETTNWESKDESITFWEKDEIDNYLETEERRFYSSCDYLWRHNLTEDMITAWENGEDFQGTFSILLVLSDSAVNTLIIPEQPYFTPFRKMLEKKIEMDMKLVANNGLSVKCHRVMIAASSDKLADLLKQEPGKRVEIMDHLAYGCIKALVDYIYCRDMNRAVYDADMALQVLEAAMEFGLDDLVEVMRKVLLVRPNQWYGVDEAVDMFLLAATTGMEEDTSEISEDGDVEIEHLDDDVNGNRDSNLEDFEDTNRTSDVVNWEPMKKRAVEVLKWYSKNQYKDLMASSKYRQLFRDPPQVAMEVGKLFLQLG